MSAQRTTKPAAGQLVQLKVHGEWLPQEYLILDKQGRTPDHLVLQNPRNNITFEQYWDEYPESCGVRLAMRSCEYGGSNGAFCEPAQYRVQKYDGDPNAYMVCRACAHSAMSESFTNEIVPLPELGDIKEWWQK